MEVHSSSKVDIPIDISLDVRDDPGASNFNNFDDSIPNIDGIPSNAFSWHGDTSRGSLSYSFTAALLFFDRRSCCILVVYSVLPLT
jgi:hypothetical protein